MSLLKLSNIGKIYVSDSNVTVGIREVNLSFERGEFVAITGKSGSGKSTLLNVISGMDSYEEGELFIEGNPTSHYLQPDWEEYRKDYISFIFQDYNIIESFTVLENVELALMHIEDAKQRRKRALELIDRVGLSSHIKHKGSKLSGGQKQRTVIARALAKDSPIILADEPTGNLDSATSSEIIELLRRVAEDKLVIVVTHNFDDFGHCATRHIRIHDGFIEFDHAISEAKISTEKTEAKKQDPSKKNELLATVKKGISLGFSIFKSKPRLTVFLCLLMMIGTLGVFGVTALCGSAADVFEPSYMFTHIDGRLVITHQSGKVISEKEIADLAEKYGAESYIRFDSLLDQGYLGSARISPKYSYGDFDFISFDCTYAENFGDNVIGRYPEAKNEVFLYLPIYMKDYFGDKEVIIDEIVMNNMPLRVVGLKYYYDNNLTPKCLFSDDGFMVATAARYLTSSSISAFANVSYPLTGKPDEQLKMYQLVPSFDIPDDKIYIGSKRYETILKTEKGISTTVDLDAVYHLYDNFGASSKSEMFKRKFTNDEITEEMPYIPDTIFLDDFLVVSDEILTEIAFEVLSKSYTQASLFFENDKEAHKAAELIMAEGYLAVPSDTTYESNAEDAIFDVALSVATAMVWVLAVIFLAFFINLCSIRSIQSFKGDMATMRSMGIQVKVIKIGIYVRMALCLIPAFIFLVVSALLIYTSSLSMYFTYLYFWQYALIVLGMIILTVRTTRKQIFRLFSESVKKSLKGGNEQ